MTQKDYIINELLEKGTITRNECLRAYISRLGAIIAKLRAEGWDFEAKYIDVTTQFGTSKDYEYRVIKIPAEFNREVA